MNKRQKEILQNELNNEKTVINQIRAVYQRAMIDVEKKIDWMQARIDKDMTDTAAVYQKRYQEALKKQIGAILDMMNANQYEKIQDYLEQCYTDAFIGNMYDLQGQGIPFIFPIEQDKVAQAIQHDTKLSKPLYESLGYNVEQLKKTIAGEISRGIATGMMYADIARNIRKHGNVSINKALTIARTEGHRIQEQSRNDAMHKAKDSGADILKQWDSTLDSRTRPTHQKLDGQIKELDEPFEVNGHKAMYPGGFGIAKEDIQCRCVSLQRAKWALDEEELEELEKRAKYFGLDKSDTLNDFKKKYMKAVESEQGLKVKIDSIKKKIADSGGSITEDHLHEAGEQVIDELKKNPDFNERKKNLESLTKQNKEYADKYHDLEKQRDKAQKDFRKKLDNYRVEGKDTQEIIDFYNNLEEELYKKQKQVYNEWVEVNNKMNKVKDEAFFDNAKAVKETLAKIRNMGSSGLDVSGHLGNSRSQMRKVIENAYDYYPSEWVQASIAHGNLTPKKVKRGYYSEYEKVIAISGGSASQMFETAIHELGHRYERAIQGIRDAEKLFYDRRTKGESLQWMGSGYGRNEVTRKDNFISPYIGKDYNETAYEIVSMGFQYAYTDPEKLLSDPDMAAFIYGILSLM